MYSMWLYENDIEFIMYNDIKYSYYLKSVSLLCAHPECINSCYSDVYIGYRNICLPLPTVVRHVFHVPTNDLTRYD